MHLRLENFDGPLDLLVHLIKAQEVNIFNIPVALICEQFMSFLRHAPDLDYLQAGEYLAMAAHLIEIKVSMLVPALQSQIGAAASLEEMADSDPRKPLVQKILEYEAIKEACAKLEKMCQIGRDQFPSGEAKRRKDEFEEYSTQYKGDSFSLVIAFERVLLNFAAKQNAPTVKVRAQKITIHSKMTQIKKRFEVQEEFTLSDLFEICDTRYELIVTLMAVLEMAKANHIFLAQAEHFTPIFISRGEKFTFDNPDIEGEPMPIADSVTLLESQAE